MLECQEIAMNNYLFIISDRLDSEGKKVTGREVYDFLMDKKVWGLHPTTQHRAVIGKGDRAIFYLSGAGGGFIGTGVVASTAYVDKSGESDNWWFNRSEVNYRVDLTDIDKWNKTKPIQPVLAELSFIKNKKTKNWGAYLQGGVRKITDDDYNVIIKSEVYEVSTPREKTISETIISFNPESAIYSPHSLQSPERIKINRIIDNVEKEWQIPNFQRYFDWNKEYIRSFLESVFNDYYVGSFLMWEASDHSNLVIEPIKGVTTSSKATHIILDGQQRMTALYYAIKTPDFPLRGSGRKKSYYYLDLRAFLEDGSREDIVVIKDKKFSRKESFEQLLFPFFELPQLHDWVDGFEEYMESESKDKTQVRNIKRTIEKRLRHMWDGFEIPYVVLPKTMDLVHVADIFEKINSTGKPLSTFDLLIARLLKYNIELKNLWDKACDDYQNIKRYAVENEKTRMTVFQIMSLLFHSASSCKRKDILDIYNALSIADKSQFESYWNTCIQALDDAIGRLENMRDGFGVRSEKDLPFMPSLSVLSALLVRIDTTENKADAYQKVHQWYWSACITGAYSSSAESQMTADFKEVTRWFDDDQAIPRVVLEARSQINHIDFLFIDEPSSASYRAVLSLIAIAGAKDFVTGNNLENARENQKDHIFPKSPTVGFGKYKHIDSVLNMTWMSDQTNMFIKRAKKPSEYVVSFTEKEFGGNEQNFIKCLESHLISSEAFETMKNDDVESFVSIREKWIKKELAERIGALTGIELKIENKPNSLIDEIEEKLRNLIDKTLSNQKADYWESHIPQGVKDGVEEKIAQYNKKHPNEKGIARTSIEKLSFCNIMDYHVIITAKVNWSEFEDRFGSRAETEKHLINFNEYRNCIKHNRNMNNVTRKLGEASLEWIDSVLKK
jgi:hypothetical protein